MLTFTNEQVESLYNATMQKKSQLNGIRTEASNLKLLIYQAIRHNVMRYTAPRSLALESASLLMPKAIPQTESAIRTISKLATLVSNDGISTLKISVLFLTLTKEVIPKLTTIQDAPVPAELTLGTKANERSNQYSFVLCGKTMRVGTVDHCFEKGFSSVVNIIFKLQACLKSRLD